MKKQIALTIIYFLIFALVPLAASQDPTPTASPTPTVEPTASPTPEPTNTTTPTPEPTIEPTPTVEPTNSTTPAPTNGTTITIPSIPEFGRLEAVVLMIGLTIPLAIAFTAYKKRKTPISSQ